MESSGQGNTIISADTVTQAGHAVEGEAAPQAPVLSESQQKSAAVVAEIFAKGAKEKLTDKEMARLSEHSKWKSGIPGAREPLENRLADPQASDHRAADGLRSELERSAAKPMAEHEKSHLVDRAVTVGADRELASEAANLCDALKLDHITADSLMRRFQHHAAQTGATGGHMPVLTEQDRAECYETACKHFGSAEKFGEQSRLARAYLAHVGALEVLDRHGWTESSLAFDGKFLIPLAARAIAAGLK